MKKLLSGITAVIVLAVGMPALAQQDDSILSDRYIISQSFVEAEVIRVRPIERTVTVRGENRGETRQFTVPEGTIITINGKEARLRHLQPGDNIRLAFVERGEKVVVDRIRVPNSDVPLSARRVAAEPVERQATVAMLPKTASFFPAILVVGLLSLAGALIVRKMRG